ncbi:cobalt/nickel transport system ATP-binding protein [Motilibacter peucedani]|uniref:Cobalt/nickel transport system ATP-binding protein n=1 Tax=Motilibacter peucedani TaxID=598650 RepID=A0A420XPP8_9ACTN|nr:ABC transporter ATP-binding protein [Motilibacter peucedani]RKS75224.1 cobalt/nickel transport system ATP-binding protein [Motilibacter peucedani]
MAASSRWHRHRHDDHSHPTGPHADHVHGEGGEHLHLEVPAGLHGSQPLPADAPADAVLVGRGLSFSYLERFPALDGVDLDVLRGEKLALLGANGCGKSTLLRVLDGLVFPTAGTLHAFGEQVTEDSLEDEQLSAAFRSRVGFVFQNSDTQVFSPTVREEVAFGCLQMGLDRDETLARVADVLEMLGIAELADRAPFQLSGGQKKRVAIASVLVMNPEVLLFDEPTAALDPRTQHWLTELLVELNEAGKTIVLATHDLEALDVLADRCVVFSEDHRAVCVGTPDAVLADRDLLLSVNLVHERSARLRG